MAVAYRRNRKKGIIWLEGPEGWIEDNKGMLEHAVQFYSSLLGKEPSSNVKLGEGFWEEDERVTLAENTCLEAPFSEDEVKEAIFGSYAEGAPGPDGFSFLFYQNFWEVIKKDFMQLVRVFEKGELNLDRLNYAMISLIPKEPEVRTLKKFRHISLLNCSFKFFWQTVKQQINSGGRKTYCI